MKIVKYELVKLVDAAIDYIITIMRIIITN